ncbi:MAG TPA: DUF2752 domain-containing protein [Candidatus Eisenbacteria bacterium]|nr:DUF2752 domain-containing protein [Candidatus Eisenbacteria bacterium]
MTWRRARSDDLPLALLWLASAVVAMALMPWLPIAARILPSCALHSMTGIPCFACGSSRAALALTQGDWPQALALNPLASLAMLAGCLGGLVAPAWVALRAPLPGLDDAASRRLRIVAWCAVLAQWAYLILTRR